MARILAPEAWTAYHGRAIGMALIACTINTEMEAKSCTPIDKSKTHIVECFHFHPTA
jgi:hypothetical protein